MNYLGLQWVFCPLSLLAPPAVLLQTRSLPPTGLMSSVSDSPLPFTLFLVVVFLQDRFLRPFFCLVSCLAPPSRACSSNLLLSPPLMAVFFHALQRALSSLSPRSPFSVGLREMWCRLFTGDLDRSQRRILLSHLKQLVYVLKEYYTTVSL